MNVKIKEEKNYFEQFCKYDQFSVDWLRGTVDLVDVGVLLKFFNEAGFSYHNWCIHEKGFHWYNSVLTYCGNRDITIAWNCSDRFPFTLFNDQPVQHHYVIYDEDGLVDKTFCFSFDCNKGCRFYPSLSVVPYNNELNLNPGVQIEVTGDGFRFLRQNGMYKKFFDVLRQIPFKPTRFDLAFDIFDKDNPFVPLCVSALYNRGNFFFKDGYPYINTRKPVNTCNLGYGKSKPNLVCYSYSYLYNGDRRNIINVEFGKHSSSVGMFRLYDKFFNSNLHSDKFRPDDCDIDYWYRFEYETKGSLALKCWEAFVSDHYNSALAFNVAAEYSFEVIDVIHDYGEVTVQERNKLWNEFLSWCSIIQNQYTAYFERSRTPNEKEAKIRYYTNMAKVSFGFLCMLSRLDDSSRLRCIDAVTKKFVLDRNSQLFLNVDIDNFSYYRLRAMFSDVIDGFTSELNSLSVKLIGN